jgi:WD40-like Beta Propeller Repeat
VNAKQALTRFRAPGEPSAEERAWTVVRAVAREHAPSRQRRRRRIAIVPVLVVLVGAVALSPAGASVRRWVSHALGAPHPAPALFALPAPGRVLVSGSGGTWFVRSDGSTRRLGSWRQASWSPHGLYVAVAGREELAAVDARGRIRWTLSRPSVMSPRWFSPTGYRVAYLSGAQLRDVAGDGTGDRLLATRVAAVSPAWRPDRPYQLAYVTRRGTLVVRDAASGRVLWAAAAPGTRTLAWSSDGERLLALGRRRAAVYRAAGQLITAVPASTRSPIVAGSLSPDGRTVALVRGQNASEVVLAEIRSAHPGLRRVLTGNGIGQLAWSPDGRWLLASWPAADQWVFIRIAGTPRIAAVSRIAQQFGSSRSPRGFPRLEGWCCTAKGPAG